MKDIILKVGLGCITLFMILALISLAFNYYTVALIFIVLAVVTFIFEIVLYLNRPKTEHDKYIIFLNKIKKTFFMLLASSSDIPDLRKKIIVRLDNIDDMVDVSENVRKPIYYIEDYDACDFVLIHDDQACVYTLRAMEGVVSRLDTYLKDLDQKAKDNAALLETLEETMVIELPSGGLFKVSPLKGKAERDRKKKEASKTSNLKK